MVGIFGARGSWRAGVAKMGKLSGELKVLTSFPEGQVGVLQVFEFSLTLFDLFLEVFIWNESGVAKMVRSIPTNRE